MAVHHGGSDNTYKMYGVRTDSWGSVANDTGSGSTFTINSNIEVEYRIRIAKGYTCNNLVFKPKLVKGTKIGAYSKYGQGSVEISTSNKNVYDKNKYPLISDRAINPSGGNTYASSSGNYCATNEYIPFSQFANKKIVCSSKSYTMCFYDKNKNYIDYISNSKTKNVPQSAYYMRFDTKKEYAENIQIELEEETSYTEHRGKTHIMPIQQKMLDGDTFEKIDGVWYEKHNKKRLDFDGTENWSFNYNSAIFMLDANNILTLSSAETSKLSNFIQSNTYSNKVYDAMYNKQTDGIEALNNRINIRESSCSTVEEFKAMLAQRYAENKAIYAVCRLKEPLLLKCTEEQSKILDKIDTYKDTTIITTDNDLCKISLRYKQNLESAIKEYIQLQM